MKKVLSIVLVVCLVFALTSCGGKKVTGSTSSKSLSGDTKDSVVTSVTSVGSSSGSSAGSSGSGSNNNKNTSSKAGNSGNSSTGSATVVTQTPKNGGVEPACTVNLRAGTVPMEKDLTFGGKTFTMAITEEPQYHTTSFKRMIAAFESKYKCKITPIKLEFGKYNQQVQQALSGKAPYDIAFMHGSMFPNAPISNLYNDLSEYITTKDVLNLENPTSGGIDINKSSYFVWKNKLVGLCEYKDVYPYVIYYNKALFKSSGLEDPMTLYDTNKWTWDKIISMGKEVTDTTAKTYFLSSDFRTWGTLHSIGVPLITIKDGKVVENFTSTGIFKGLSLIKTLFKGSSTIAEPFVSSVGKYDSFYNGTVFMTMEESSKFSEVAETVATKIAFGRTKNNLGIVPVPLDRSEKATNRPYPTGWLTATCSGTGSSDPRVAVAFAKFKSTYNDPVVGTNEMNADQKKLVTKLISGNLCFGHGGYFDSTHSSVYIGMSLPGAIADGADISQTINELRPQVQACIKATVG